MSAESKPPTHSGAHSTHSADSRPEFLITLGLIPPCTVEDVKQAYLAKVKTAHPDAGGDTAEFRKIQEAFERATEWAKFRASRIAWLSTWVEKYVEQDGIVGELQRRGGIVHTEGVDWLRRSFGEDFSHVAEKLTKIQWHGPAVDDKAIAWLSDHRAVLASLKSLDLTRSAVTDAGIQHLAAFSSLHELDLSETKVSASGLAVLDHLPNLQWLGLRKTSVGWLARIKLKVKHPKLEVAT
jgi:Leucine rich repeat